MKTMSRTRVLLFCAASAAVWLTMAAAQADEPAKDIFGGFITKPNDMDKWHRGAVKEISDNKIVVADQKFKPDALVGKVICPNYERPVIKGADAMLYCDRYYKITANTEDTITTDPTDGKLTEFAKAGDKYLMAGFFRIEKSGNHWVMLDPLDHPYLPMGVSLWNNNITGYLPDSLLKEKYGTREKYIEVTVEKMHGMGWNTAWETGWPVMAQNKTGGYYHPQMPHMKQCMGATLMGAKPKANGGRWESPLKNISEGLGTGGFVDVYDPQYARTYGKDINEPWGTTPQMKNDPWLIGYTVEEGDLMFGFLRPGFSLGWCALAGMPEITQSKSGVVYSDPTNYTKHEIVKWLKGKYGAIAKLNAAWGSTYTTFDSDGGYGKGKGLLDEDGKLGQAWLGKPLAYNIKDWKGANEACKKDVLTFQTMLTEKFCRDAYVGMKANSPDHLVLGLCYNTEYADDYWALSRWVDLTYAPPPEVVMNMKDIGKNVIKPYCVSVFLGADEDSAMAEYYQPPKPGHRYPGSWVQTQAQRGQEYYNRYVGGFPKLSASGSRDCIGLIWWSWADMGNEKRNWGIVSLKDNMYDGKEATRKGADGKEGTSDDEKSNYGDCVTKIRQANAEVVRMFLDEQAGKKPTGRPTPTSRGAQDVPDNPLDQPGR